MPATSSAPSTGWACLQIDSVNVLTRAHYLPLFSRLGNYASDHLDRIAWGRKSQRGLFEFWAHEASLLPLVAHPLFRWRMQRARENAGDGKGKLHLFRQGEGEIHRRGAARDRRPRAARRVGAVQRRRTARRLVGLERRQARRRMAVLRRPASPRRRGAAPSSGSTTSPSACCRRRCSALPTPSAEEAQRELLRRSAEALGVATEFDLRDYFRLGVADTKARLAELVEAGDLLPVEVEGWDRPAYLHPAARQPRKVEARALLAPFDPLIWERDRTHRIFDFFYRIGIYTPVAKRTHGYYVLPFLLGDRLVARVDLKADRANSKLLVHAAHLEEGQDAGPSRRTAARRAAADGRLARPRKRIPAPRRRAGEGHGADAIKQRLTLSAAKDLKGGRAGMRALRCAQDEEEEK